MYGMTFETQTPQTDRKNYEISGGHEYRVGRGERLTIPAASFLATPADNRKEYSIETPLYLKAIVTDNADFPDEKTMVFQAEEGVVGPDGESTVVLVDRERLQEVAESNGGEQGLRIEDIAGPRSWIRPGQLPASSKNSSFLVEADEAGDVVISGYLEDVDVIAPLLPTQQ
jgi:hypothetical protein